MGALTNAVQGYLMGKQRKDERMSNKFMGNMLMGQSSPEEQQQFAQLNPQQYMQAQGQLQQQEQAQQAQAQRARQAKQKKMIQQVYSAAVSGDEGAMGQLASASPTLHKQAMDIMAAQGKSELLLNSIEAILKKKTTTKKDREKALLKVESLRRFVYYRTSFQKFQQVTKQ